MWTQKRKKTTLYPCRLHKLENPSSNLVYMATVLCLFIYLEEEYFTTYWFATQVKDSSTAESVMALMMLE